MDEAPATELLPIFPLENVVLFPDVRVPLHVFEPRYRQMARDALDAERRIGMVTVRPEFVSEMRGNPAVYPIGCEGRIVEARELDGGRFELLLHGTRRFRIVGEEPPGDERLYRVAHITALEDLLDETDRERVATLRRDTHALMRELVRRIAPARSAEFDAQDFTDVEDAAFANALAQSMDFAAAEKQGLLESDSVRERYERLASLMRFRLAQVSRGGVAGPDVLQ